MPALLRPAGLNAPQIFAPVKALSGARGGLARRSGLLASL